MRIGVVSEFWGIWMIWTTRCPGNPIEIGGKPVTQDT
jgi:hypothetical protein